MAGEFLLLFMDETSLTLHPPLRACWMKRGRQKRIPTPGKPQWHHLFGAYHFVTDELLAMPAECKDSDTFIAFLDLLVQQLPVGVPIMLVLDNASYHHSHATRAAFALLEQRIYPLFLPAYCSLLNPIERFWQHLKSLAAANTLYPAMPALLANVLVHVANQNDPAHPDRFTLCKDLQLST
jgi:putative transposase